MPSLKEDAALHPNHLVRARHTPTAEDAAKAKSFINFLMEDRFFLALYRSNDPDVRAAAIDKLNKAHYQAYGDAPTDSSDSSATERK